jgi:molecular chaperone DnaK
MLAEAEKYASADKEKRETIDLKNQAETLCFEAEKELFSKKILMKKNITKLIEEIRQNIQSNDFESLKSSVENLKTAMKEMVAAKSPNDLNSDPMSNLNDL